VDVDLFARYKKYARLGVFFCTPGRIRTASLCFRRQRVFVYLGVVLFSGVTSIYSWIQSISCDLESMMVLIAVTNFSSLFARIELCFDWAGSHSSVQWQEIFLPASRLWGGLSPNQVKCQAPVCCKTRTY
jgi:hypothetical protein